MWQVVNALSTSIDATSSDTILDKSPNVAHNIINVMANNYYSRSIVALRGTS